MWYKKDEFLYNIKYFSFKFFFYQICFKEEEEEEEEQNE